MVRIVAFISLMLLASASSATIYKCTDAAGQITYGDTACGSDSKSEPVAQAPPARHTAPAPAPRISTPGTGPAGRDNPSLENIALACSTRTFNEWVRSQGLPLPEPAVRQAKLIEISNQCRRPLGLSDMKPPPPITTPKPILRGPEGEAAAANLKELVRSGSKDRLLAYLQTPGVDINDRPSADEALLDYAAEQNQVLIAKLLIEHGAKVDAAQSQGRDSGTTALHRAALVDAAEVAQLFLADGAEVNVHGPLGVTPLILAARSGSRRTVEVLLNHGADVMVTTGHSETALSEAEAQGHPEIVRLLLEHLPTPTSSTMANVAIRGELETLRTMLKHDELVHDVGKRIKDEALRFTILGPELIDERKQMIELLLTDGADIDNRPPGLEQIPAMLAIAPAMVDFLFAHGANTKAHLSGAQLAIGFVCNEKVKDPVGVLQVLLGHNIDISGTTPQGMSAARCAERSNNPTLVAFLEKHQGMNRAGALVATPAALSHASAPTQVSTMHSCESFEVIDNSHSPVELYASVADCLQNHRDTDAVGLFLLAGMDSSFDTQRVIDKSGAGARQILIMSLLDGMPADQRARFDALIKQSMADQQRHAALCAQVGRMGPPRYFPAYMVNHGLGIMMGALSNKTPGLPLDPNFNAPAAWTELQASYLDCGK